MPNLQATTVKKYIENDDTPKEVKELLKIRQSSTKISTKKYEVLKIYRRESSTDTLVHRLGNNLRNYWLTNITAATARRRRS